MNKISLSLIAATLLFNFELCVCQNSKLVITPFIKLPHDSLIKERMLKSLNIFLNDKNQNLENSTVIDKKHYQRYKDFFDIFKNAEKSNRYKDTAFFKCHLTNIVLQPDKSYKISLSYLGVSPDKAIINRLNTTFIARQDGNLFKFYCPFEENTRYWKSKKIGNIAFYYEYDFNPAIAKDFEKYNSSLAKKLKTAPLQFKYYKCRDIHEVYQLMGIDYDINQNGNVRSGAFDTQNMFFLSGTNSDQYKHDLTHTYMGLLYPDSLRNWTAEEGYNIYTTDYWGESSQQVFQYLSNYAKANPDISLLDVFEKNIILKYPIPIRYPIAAVIMRKVDKEFGFDKVLQLILCGASDDNFLPKLKEITGISKETFDSAVRTEIARYD
jgi:hypothetical protein